MAVFILVLHLAVILFMIVGFPVGLIFNHRRFRLVHAGCLAFITLLMILNIPCPLTILEEELSGQSYEGSFIATWLNNLIYVVWVNPRTVFIADMVFAVLVFSSFWWKPLKPRPEPKNSINS